MGSLLGQLQGPQEARQGTHRLAPPRHATPGRGHRRTRTARRACHQHRAQPQGAGAERGGGGLLPHPARGGRQGLRVLPGHGAADGGPTPPHQDGAAVPEAADHRAGGRRLDQDAPSLHLPLQGPPPPRELRRHELLRYVLWGGKEAIRLLLLCACAQHRSLSCQTVHSLTRSRPPSANPPPP